jgi:hypothetical protein
MEDRNGRTTNWRDAMERIDLAGLRPEDVKLMKELLEFLKTRAAQEELPERDIEYRSWPLGVRGKITRREIYDYL